jgi:2-oxoglutarate dehydrogenase E2 component (dihydrolipoamide succinyltransferase)
MALVPITVPGVGESITEGILARWLKPDGSLVQSGEPLFELETDKASTVVPAATAGLLKIAVAEGQTVAIGATVGSLDPAGSPTVAAAQASPQPAGATVAQPAPPADVTAAKSAPEIAAATSADGASQAGIPLSPAVRRIVSESAVDPQKVTPTGPGGRLTKGDVLSYLSASTEAAAQAAARPEAPGGAATAATGPAPAGVTAGAPPQPPVTVQAPAQRETRSRMSGLRQRIAHRLVEAQQTAAILTTFNEVDMSRVMDLRARYKELSKNKFGISLGFMSFFVKAATTALKEFPAVNARIDGSDIVLHHYYDVGVAVSTERGLIVPVLRDVDAMSFADIEKAISGYAEKARKGTITVDELQGGTFTITNGGVFGSLFSTPILNPPQSGILGMHAIKKRPVVVDDQIVIRPMMYLALSYDHRIIDGREAVSFLVRIKECVEDPERILLSL